MRSKFELLNCIVIGISKDNINKQGKFREKYNLTCELGADFENNVCEQFGVWVEKSMYGRKYMGIQRSTFLCDENGIIKKIWEKISIFRLQRKCYRNTQPLRVNQKIFTIRSFYIYVD